MTDASTTEPDERALNAVNAEWNKGGMAATLAVGWWVLQTFCDGAPSAWHKHGRRSVRFRRVLDHPRLTIPRAHLLRCVDLTVQFEELGVDIREHLSLPHQQALLTLHDKAARESMARTAIREGWSARRLGREVAITRTVSRRGRPPTPLWLVKLRRLHAAVALPGGTPHGDVAGTAREAAVLIAEFRSHLPEIKRWLAKVESGLTEPPAERICGVPCKHAK